MKKVIGFDNWTKGSRHFERLVPELEQLGYQLILIHVGSWGHDQETPKEQYINNLLVRDVSFYEGKSLSQIMLTENPDVVIFLSTRAFVLQSLNRYCKIFNIPTLHIYHGLVSVQDVETEVKININVFKRLYDLRNRLLKNFKILIPVYVKSLIKTNASFSDWGWFIWEIYIKATGKVSGVAPPDTTTTAGCVYTNADVLDMVRTYRIPENEIHAVGNPDLVQFGLRKNDMCNAIYSRETTKNEIFYISTGFSLNGIVFADDKEFVAHILTSSQALARQGYRLVVKLHPNYSTSDVPFCLNELGIDLCQNEDFIQRLKSCGAVMVEPSTAAIIPALMGLPVFLVQYGKLSEQRYGSVLTSYPRAYTLDDIGKFKILMREHTAHFEPADVTDWVDKNSGPMPAEDMPHRVARVIDKICQK